MAQCNFDSSLGQQAADAARPQGMKDFFREQLGLATGKKLFVSPRFVDSKGEPLAFEIRGISQDELESIKAACRRPKPGSGEYWLDMDLYNSKLIVTATVYPDFKDADLQRSWGVLGAEPLAKAMLLAGEYQELLQEIRKLCGFSVNLKSAAAEVKN